MSPNFIITNHARERARHRFGHRVADSLASLLEDSEDVGGGLYDCGDIVAVTKPGRVDGEIVVVTVMPAKYRGAKNV